MLVKVVEPLLVVSLSNEWECQFFLRLRWIEQKKLCCLLKSLLQPPYLRKLVREENKAIFVECLRLILGIEPACNCRMHISVDLPLWITGSVRRLIIKSSGEQKHCYNPHQVN